MANLYGVANNIGVPQYTGLVGSANVAVPIGTETNIADSGLIIAPSNGYFVPVWAGTVLFTSGATVPTAVTLAARIGAGADFMSLPVAASLFVASQNTIIPFFFAGPSSQVAWQTPGSHCYLTLVCTGQPITAIQNYSATCFMLARGPDA